VKKLVANITISLLGSKDFFGVKIDLSDKQILRMTSFTQFRNLLLSSDRQNKSPLVIEGLFFVCIKDSLIVNVHLVDFLEILCIFVVYKKRHKSHVKYVLN